jgi:hypothetical protein
MAKKSSQFGPHKYIALNLLLSKWLRKHAKPGPYCYVTLGGSELRDILNLNWIDQSLTTRVFSFEQDPVAYKEASKLAGHYKGTGLEIEVEKNDLFSYKRTINDPHIFFIDLLRNCSRSNYQAPFRKWFESDVIRPGDLLIITSYLGRHPGWSTVLKAFDAEFRLLKIQSKEDRKRIYSAYHPMLVLNRSLEDCELQDELVLDPVCSIKYFDSSTMGLYGIVCGEGQTTLSNLVKVCHQVDLTKSAKQVFTCPN